MIWIPLKYIFDIFITIVYKGGYAHFKVRKDGGEGGWCKVYKHVKVRKDGGGGGGIRSINMLKYDAPILC